MLLLRRFLPLAALAVLPLVGCYKGANIEFTDPADGATDVPADLETIRIGFSTDMEAESIADVTNYQIRGSASGLWSFTASYVGNDVDEEAGEIPRVLTLTLAGRASGSGDVDPEAAPSGDTFEPGEVVTVSLSNNILSSINVPIDDTSFSFTISGAQDVGPEDGQFTVATTSPTSNQVGVAPQAPIVLNFQQQVPTSQLAVNPLLESRNSRRLFVRGDRTGTIDRAISLVAQEELSREGDATVMVAGGVSTLFTDGFQAGEKVTVSFAAGATGLSLDGAPPPVLLGHQFEYTVRSGRVLGGFADVAAPAIGPGVSFTQPSQVFLADIFRTKPGLEMVVIDGQRVQALVRQSERWSVAAGDDALLSTAIVQGRMVDYDDDERIELVLLLSDGSFQAFEGNNGALVPLDAPIVSGAGGASSFVATDISGNGLVDLVVGDSTGLVLLLQQITPDENGNLFREFVVTDFDLGEAVLAVEHADFNEDGRDDLMVTTAGATRFFTRVSSPGEPLELIGRGSLDPAVAVASLPQVADFEGDGDVDVVAIGPDGLSVFLNQGVGVVDGTIWAGQAVALPDVSVESFHLANLDGDSSNFTDLAVFDGAGNQIVVYTRTGLEPTQWVATEVPVAGQPDQTRLLAADTNGDRGLDLVLYATAGSGRLGVGLAQSVISGTDQDYRFETPASVAVDLMAPSQEFVVPVRAKFVQGIAGFTCALDFDPSEMTLLRVEEAPGAFTGATVVLSEPEPGVVVGTVSSETPLPARTDATDFLRYVFRLITPAPGNYDYALVASIGDQTTSMTVADEAMSEQVPSLSGAGQVVASASVLPVDDLLCEPGYDIDGEGEVTNYVDLSWTLPPSGYDLVNGIRVFRNGAEIATLVGTKTSFRDSTLTSSVLTYEIQGRLGGVYSPLATCSLTLIPVPSLTCQVIPGSTRTVVLSWTAPVGTTYERIYVSLDGQPIASLVGSQTSYSTPVDQQGHVFTVVAEIDDQFSAPAMCSVPDLDPTVAPPTGVTTTLSGEFATVAWMNGESYDSIEIHRSVNGSGSLIATLEDGSATTFADPEALLPGAYVYQVAGVVDGVSSTLASAPRVDLGLIPPLGLSCVTDGGFVDLSWTIGSSYYTSIEVLRGDASGGPPMTVIAMLDATETAYTDLVTEGDYQYLVRGRIGAETAESSVCAVTVASRVRVLDLVSSPGLTADLRVVADLIQDVENFSFVVRYDSARFTFESVFVPNGQLVAAPEPTIPAGEPMDSTIRQLSIGVTSAFIEAGGDVEIATILGSVPASFSAQGQSTIAVSNALLQGSEAIAESGTLDARPFALVLGNGAAEPGDVVDVAVFGTFSSAISGFTVGLQFDPTVLTCVSTQPSDDVIDILTGLTIPIEVIDNEEGFAQVALVATGSIPSGILVPLYFVRFEVAPDAPVGINVLQAVSEVPSTMASASIVLSGGGSSVAPALFDGTLTITGEPDPPVLTAIDPDAGSIAGGDTVHLTGSNFTPDVTVDFGGVAATNVAFLSSTSVSVTTPPATMTGLVEVVVSNSIGSSEPMLFEYLEVFELTGAQPSSVPTCTTTPLIITGSGMPQLPAEVFLSTNPTTALQVLQQGVTEIVVALPLFAAAETNVDVIVRFPGFAEVVLPDALDVTESFVRGDFDGDGVVALADLEALAAYVLASGPAPAYFDAADCNDDGAVNTADIFTLREHLLTDGGLPQPFPAAGTDPTPDFLDCDGP